jgi:hypothetical protein
MDGREPRDREKESCVGDRARHYAGRKHTIYVSLLDARDWSEKSGDDRSTFFVAVVLGSRYSL